MINISEKFFYFIFQDWKENDSNLKSRMVLVLFRLAIYLRRKNIWFLVLLTPYFILYRIFVEWVLGIELSWNLNVGPGLRLYHGVALVVNDGVLIGSNVVLRHSTTIGVKTLNDGSNSAAPIIGDNVDIGAHVVIIGPVVIGNGAVIGAGSVVVKDVPPYSVVVGNPAKVIRSLS